MSEQILIISVILIIAFIIQRILPLIFGIKRELKGEKEEARKLAAMTPEEILAREKVDIRKKVNIFHIIGFVASFALFIPCLMLGFYIIDKFYLEETIGEIIIIVFSIAVGFGIMLFGIIKFGKDGEVMQIRELRSIGRVKHYYLYTFIKSLLVIITIAGMILLLWYFGVIKNTKFLEETENIACTQEAKLCPDGSTVGRTGPNCEFPECPISNVSCKENSKYFVISRENNGVSDFLVKNKTSNNQVIPCSYDVEEGNFELKNQTATYFLALTDNFLVLDMGTAPPPRTLIVYNLGSRNEIYTDSYSGLAKVRDIGVLNDTITYWNPTNEKVTGENCPKLSEYTAGGLGAEIEAKISLNLSNLVKKELGEYRCQPTQ